ATPAPTPAAPTAAAPFATEVARSALQNAAERVSAIEARVDSALDGVEARLQDLAARSGIPSAPGELREAVARLLPSVKGRLAQALDLLRLLEPPERLDRFGMDARFAERFDVVVEILCSIWWRVTLLDAGRVPDAGPAVVVANHAGTVPWNALVLRHALRRQHPARRDLRPLLDDAECDLPFIGTAAVRYGAVRASPEAARAILSAGDLVGVFPEGSAVAKKPWRDRYRIQRFGRGGFVKVALRAGAPIVPCAVVGSEEASPAISRTGWLAERLGISLVAGTSALRLGTAALLPLPSRWTLRFGEPIDVRGHGAAEADEPTVVGAIADRVRTSLQAMLDEGIAARTSVFL
ncbi:MAG TPA: lysophospholipid acyltransferase family protein, partial [Anaeromyxobacter sp.]